jgi:hypothetical protein
MRAVLIREHGAPETLKFEKIAAATFDDDEVLIDIHAAGHAVILYDTRSEAIDAALGNIRKTFQILPGALLVVDGIVENLEVKRGLFADLEDVVGADCILVTNTSSISVTALAAKLRLSGRLATDGRVSPLIQRKVASGAHFHG